MFRNTQSPLSAVINALVSAKNLVNYTAEGYAWGATAQLSCWSKERGSSLLSLILSYVNLLMYTRFGININTLRLNGHKRINYNVTCDLLRSFLFVRRNYAVERYGFNKLVYYVVIFDHHTVNRMCVYLFDDFKTCLYNRTIENSVELYTRMYAHGGLLLVFFVSKTMQELWKTNT